MNKTDIRRHARDFIELLVEGVDWGDIAEYADNHGIDDEDSFEKAVRSATIAIQWGAE